MIITRKHVYSFIFLAIFSVIQFSLFNTLAQPVYADDTLIGGQTGMTEIGKVYGEKSKTDVRVIIANFVEIVLGFLAAIFVVLTIYAGFRYMTASGNEEQTRKALAQIRDAVIGLLIVLSAWAITLFILRILSRAVNNSINY
jgi:hypothetical protein